MRNAITFSLFSFIASCSFADSNSLTRVRPQAEKTPRSLTSHPSIDPQLHVHVGVRLIHIRLMRRDEISESGDCSPQTDRSEKSSGHRHAQEIHHRNLSHQWPRKHPGIRPRRCFGFHTMQSISPVISLSISAVGAVLQNSESGVIELGAGIGDIEIRDECYIAPIPLATLFTNASSFARTKKSGKGLLVVVVFM